MTLVAGLLLARLVLPQVHAQAVPGIDSFHVGENIYVRALTVDPQRQSLWVGTSVGALEVDLASHAVKNSFTREHGLANEYVFAIGVAPDSSVWFGTNAGGASRWRDGEWTTYFPMHGLADYWVYAFDFDDDEKIWIATWSGANLVHDGRMDDTESWDLFTVENTGGGLPSDWVYGLAEASDGSIWLATEGGLAHYEDGVWQNWDHADGLGADYALVEKSIQFKSDPAARSGHHARQKQERQLEEVSVAYNPNYVVGLAIDPDGVVWAGTWGAGLSRFDGDTWQTFTIRDGLPANHVFMLEIDPGGRLWIGTSEGLALCDGRKFIRYTEQHGLVSNTVFSMAFAPDGSAWVGSYGGVTGFPPGF
ncbi:MAG: two-component regulator propeller domain-containing protein [Alphaproteobacteria bacterium]